MITLRLGILLILFPITLSAQTQKQISGYYINLKGDTLHGIFPKYQDWVNNPSEVKFVSVNTNDPIILTAANCREFYVDTYDRYIAYSGSRMVNSITYNSSFDETDSTGKYENINTFLRVIFEDKDFKLFIFQDKSRINFFYEDGNMPITELINKLYLDSENNLISVNTYQEQLKQLCLDKMSTKNIDVETGSLQYTENNLVHFLNKVFNMPKEREIKNRYPNSFFVSGGTAINSINVNGDPTFSGAPAAKYKNTMSPALAIGFYFPVQRNFGRLCFSAQLKLYNYKNSGDYYENVYGNYTHTNITCKADLLIMPGLYITYALISHKNIQWNIGPGLEYGLSSGTKQIIVTTSSFESPNTEVEDGRNSLISLNFQTALIIKKRVIILINHSFPGRTNTSAAYSVNQSSTQFTAGWVFHK